VGVAPQIVHHGSNGFLFASRDSRAMMRAIDEALAARASWPEFGARAREAVSSMGLSAVVQQYVTLCHELLRKGAAG
jgi:glycosyltransferase involved in cell wall biosynthesis